MLKNDIGLKRDLLSDLRNDVMQLNKKLATKKSTKQITMADLRESNVLRKQLEKVEQSVFLLRYHVGKLLSLAS